ncbi:MAG: ribosome small subunit-dependent GTPase A [Lachnospiraceae bacterium]|nr:ribosome small subunit-dependent GTPase A [Lachnospiraceae bacterium]
MKGRIVKGIAGFYYVYTSLGLLECRAKGIFRKDGIKPLVGDEVEVEALPGDDMEGNIIRILPRKSMLIRPAAANIDQAIIIFAIVRPDPNYNLLDRFLIRMRKQDIPTVICFNKTDLSGEDEMKALLDAYENCGHRVLFLSGEKGEGLGTLKEALKGHTSVVAGPSGVGKSTIINALYPEANMETGSLSRKIDRGKHTTRHAELFALSQDTFIMDTPGFTSLSLEDTDKDELKDYYPEFEKYEPECRFALCSHISEPVCGVRRAVKKGLISPIRYENYTRLYADLKDIRRYDQKGKNRTQ